MAFTEDVAARFEAYGWFVQTVGGDGNDITAVARAIEAAQREHERPSLIKIRTHIGYGSPNKHDTPEAHGSPLGEAEVALTKQQLGWDPEKKFYIPEQALTWFREAIPRGVQREQEWGSLYARYAEAHSALAQEFDRASERLLSPDWARIWQEHAPKFDPVSLLATREAQGKILDAIMPKLPLVVGGSADLTPSNNTRFKGVEDFTRKNRTGRYLRFGVREHGMGAILNGIAVSDMLIPFGATFFCFTDYMRPAIRLAALSQYPSIFVYTHDSIGLGEDGPTHQAVEQLASFRAMPGMVTIRPADANETIFAWKLAFERRTGPTMLIVTRQKLPILDQGVYAKAENVSRGAYVLIGAEHPRVLLLASGSEVHLAIQAHKKLGEEGIPTRVVSMPSWELFELQPEAYRNSVLPTNVTARVAVEAGVSLGWERYIGTTGRFIGMKTFGASAPADAAFKGFGITVENVVIAAKELLS
jgi:transketolase